MWCRIVIRGGQKKYTMRAVNSRLPHFCRFENTQKYILHFPFGTNFHLKKGVKSTKIGDQNLNIFCLTLIQTSPLPHPHRYPYPTLSQIINCSNLFCPIDHRTSKYRTRIFPTFPIEVTQREWLKSAKFRWTFRAVKGNKPRKPGKEINEINQKLWIKGWYKYDDIFTWQGVLRSSTFFIVYPDGIFKKAVRS